MTKDRPYGFVGGGGRVDAGEAAGEVVPAGNTPTPESGAADEAGEAWIGVPAGDEAGERWAAAGADELCGAAWFFISSRRKALSAVLL